MKYDFIFCGAGYTNLTFVYKLLSLKKFEKIKILVIDSNLKKINDKTWCFWHIEENFFTSIVHHSWNYLNFYSDNFSKKLHIKPYKYSMIKSIDLYDKTLDFIRKFENVAFEEEEVLSFETKNGQAFVKTNKNEYSASYIFNATLISTSNKINTPNSLLQHFKGIEIETTENIFDPETATFMDFSVDQNKGTTFVYTLPTAKNKALIEYTFFTKEILKNDEYDKLLKDYIEQKLNIKQYKITHSEFGIIPMTDYVFEKNNGRIINVGTASGAVKASSGFAFMNIQKQINKLVTLLANDKPPILRRTFENKKFHFYDSVLLEVIATKKMQGSHIFTLIFKKNKPPLVLKFLDNETNIFEDLKIMSSVPMKIFLPIALKKIIKNIFS